MEEGLGGISLQREDRGAEQRTKMWLDAQQSGLAVGMLCHTLGKKRTLVALVCMSHL